MVPSLSPAREARRIAELYSFGILDTPRERSFDCLVQRAADLLGVPSALISFADRDRHWIKARVRAGRSEWPTPMTFCQYTVVAGAPLIVENACSHPLFADHPLVVGAPCIRFYTGAPLVTTKGNAVGTLCVIDFKPRAISSGEVAALVRLARAITGQIEMRATVRELNAVFSCLGPPGEGDEAAAMEDAPKPACTGTRAAASAMSVA